MKIVQINTCSGSGSTGKICESVSRLLDANGIENKILYFNGSTDCGSGIKCSSLPYEKIQALKSRIFGNYGFNSKLSTNFVIHHLEKIQPDIVHLHNLHGHEVNIELLLSYLKKKHIKIVWTMHDCWLFTGYCPHFTAVKCEKWETGCHDCIQREKYSWFLDRSREIQERKVKAMKNADVIFVTPSEWLAELVRKSMLSKHSIVVINNGIDLNIFKPTPSNFREKNCIKEEEKMILGVAFGWGENKGLDLFIKLASILEKEYVVVLVGTDEMVDRMLPSNIISIHKTADQAELAEIYSAANVFVNCTREDNYPTVNMEAIACGTPVVTAKVGGAAEMVDQGSGMCIDSRDVEIWKREIVRVANEDFREECLRKSKEFAEEICFSKYIDLYAELNREH